MSRRVNYWAIKTATERLRRAAIAMGLPNTDNWTLTAGDPGTGRQWTLTRTVGEGPMPVIGTDNGVIGLTRGEALHTLTVAARTLEEARWLLTEERMRRRAERGVFRIEGVDGPITLGSR